MVVALWIAAALLVITMPSPVSAAGCLKPASEVSLTGTVLLTQGTVARSDGRGRYYALSLDAPVCVDGQEELAALEIQFRRLAFKRKWRGRHVSIQGNLIRGASPDGHTAVLIRPEKIAIAPFATGSFPLASCDGWNATITQLLGVNSSQARMRGAVTDADIRQYCSRRSASPDSEHAMKQDRQCVKRTRAAIGKLAAAVEVTADCAQEVIGGGSEPDYQLVQRKGEGGNEVEFAWRELKTGQTLGVGCRSRAPLLSAQFRLLCPGRALKDR